MAAQTSAGQGGSKFKLVQYERIIWEILKDLAILVLFFTFGKYRLSILQINIDSLFFTITWVLNLEVSICSYEKTLLGSSWMSL